MRFLITSVLMLVQISSYAQTTVKAYEGIITNSISGAPLPYCNISSLSGNYGTISNKNGYFKLNTTSDTDTLVISFVGYETYFLYDSKDILFHKIQLKEKPSELAEATVKPKNQKYLFDLIQSCRKITGKNTIKSKAYYELKSRINDEQIELVETFYNAETEDYNLKTLDLKAGRLALQKFENRIFASVQNARAIVMHSSIERNPYFLATPLELNKRKNKAVFFLGLEKKYVNEELDSVYIISFKPKPSKTGFKGKLWINKSKFRLLKMELECENCQAHPFLPLFPSDSLSNVNLRIYKTFVSDEVSTKIDYIDFTTSYTYKSRKDFQHKSSYKIESEALLYFYDYHQSFELPKMNMPKEGITDYAKISSMPFNSFFWNKNNEYKLHDQTNKNELYFINKNSITNKTLFNASKKEKRKNFFESPFLHWTGERFLIREMTTDTNLIHLGPSSFPSDYYNLEVEIFLDINEYSDSLDVLTSTFINPYFTYYHLEMDAFAQCALNIFFDLMEIERREFQDKIKKLSDSREIIEHYKKLQLKIKNLKKIYFSQVVRGTNRPMLKKWNQVVFETLEIDNISLFGIYREE